MMTSALFYGYTQMLRMNNCSHLYGKDIMMNEKMIFFMTTFYILKKQRVT